jgi:hypothetical protein
LRSRGYPLSAFCPRATQAVDDDPGRAGGE